MSAIDRRGLPARGTGRGGPLLTPGMTRIG